MMHQLHRQMLKVFFRFSKKPKIIQNNAFCKNHYLVLFFSFFDYHLVYNQLAKKESNIADITAKVCDKKQCTVRWQKT